MAHITTVIWDWNGTLLDDVALCARLIDTLLTRHGYAPVGSLEKYRQVFRFPVRAYYEDVGFDFSRHPFDELAAEYMELYTPQSEACGLVPGALDTVRRLREKGLRKTVRVMVVGIPNVGKSTLINKLAGTTMAATGNRPGVTRGKQWVKISPYLELMDTPGMLWPKFTDEQSALRLAYLGSIRDEIIDGEELSIALLEDLATRVPDLLAQRYKKLDAAQAGEALLEGVCKSRGFILPGGVLDLERGAKTVLDEFRAGKIGRISLERPEDIRAAEPAGEAASAKPEELP